MKNKGAQCEDSFGRGRFFISIGIFLDFFKAQSTIVLIKFSVFLENGRNST